jgi:hypothetical protein
MYKDENLERSNSELCEEMIYELTTIKTNNNKKAAYNNKNNNNNNHFLLKSFNLCGSRNQLCKLINKNIINT